MQVYLFIFVFVFACVVGYSQTITELETRLKTARDTTRVHILDDLCVKHQYKYPLKALEYGFAALREARKLDYEKGVAFAYNDLGVVFGIQQDYDKALTFFLKALAIKRELGDARAIAQTLNNIALVYKYLDDYVRAIAYMKEALQLKHGLGDRAEVAFALNSMAVTYTEYGRYDTAKMYFDKMRELAVRHDLMDKWLEAIKNTGWLYVQQQLYDTAVFWYRKALDYEIEQKDTCAMARSFTHLGNIALRQGKYEEAITWIGKGQPISWQCGATNAWIKSLKSLVRAHFHLADYDHVLQLATTGERLCDSLGMQAHRAYFQEQLCKTYDTLGLSGQAFDHYKIWKNLQEQLASEAKQKQLARTKVQFDLSQKESELIGNQQLLDRQHLIIMGLAVGIITLSVGGYYLLAASRSKQKRSQSREKQLSQDLKSRSKSLTTCSLDNVKKTHLISDIQSRINQIPQDTLDHEGRREVSRLKEQIRFHLSKARNHQDAVAMVKTADPDFYSYMASAYPQLTANELKVCTLARLNMNTKDMADILGISPQGAKVARYRIRKKLGMPTPQDFNTFFMQVATKY